LIVKRKKKKDACSPRGKNHPCYKHIRRGGLAGEKGAHVLIENFLLYWEKFVDKIQVDPEEGQKGCN